LVLPSWNLVSCVADEFRTQPISHEVLTIRLNNLASLICSRE
jgi:hypothetical protein